MNKRECDNYRGFESTVVGTAPLYPLHGHPSLLALCPLLAYAYVNSLVDRLKSEEWTFLACGSFGADHALGFLATRWSTAACAFRTSRSVGSIQDRGCFRIAIVEQRGKGEIVS